MPTELEEVISKITELTNTVKENKGTEGLNKEQLETTMKGLLEEYHQKLIDTIPNRSGEAGEVPNLGDVPVKGRYAQVAKQLQKNGFAKVNGTEVKAIDFVLARELMEKAVAGKQTGAVAPSEDLVAISKAMTSTGTGTGKELVPENLAGEIWEDMFAQSKVFADIPEQPMTSDPMDISLLGNMSFAKGTQNTGATGQDLTTAQSKLTTTELLAEVDWSYNLDEDAVIAVMPTFRREAARAGAEYMDAFALNADATDADTGNINLVDANPDNTSYYLSAGQDGIRHQFSVDNNGQMYNMNGALSDAGMNAMMALTKKYSLDLNNCRIVPDVQTYLAMLGLTNVATVDKYGAQATIAVGELAKYRGIPVIPASVMSLTNANGFVSATGANNVKGQIAFYNRLMWRRGSRRGLTIEIDRDIQKRQMIMVTSFRIAVGCWGTRASAYHTSGMRNITV